MILNEKKNTVELNKNFVKFENFLRTIGMNYFSFSMKKSLKIRKTNQHRLKLK